MLGIDWNNTRSNFDPESLLQDFNTLYLLNADSTASIQVDGSLVEQRDQITNLEKYQYEIEFSPEAYKASRFGLTSARRVSGLHDQVDAAGQPRDAELLHELPHRD